LESGGMSRLTLFGLFAVTAMLVCYAFENRSRWYILAFSAACCWARFTDFCKSLAIWIVEGVWSVVALRRWWLAGKSA